jgi:hypothetical protein
MIGFHHSHHRHLAFISSTAVAGVADVIGIVIGKIVVCRALLVLVLVGALES